MKIFLTLVAAFVGIINLAPTHALAAVVQPTFTSTVIDSSMAGDVKALGDIDGDGYIDGVVGGNANGEDMYWYQYPTWTKHLIAEANVEFTTDMQLGDVDNDGDLDVIVPDYQIALRWYENPRPAGNPTSQWTPHVIDPAFDHYHDLEVTDFDHDGKLDVLVRGNGAFVLYFQNTATSWTKRANFGIPGGEGLGIGDVDKDGDIDFIAAGKWYEQPASNSRTATWATHGIAASVPSESTSAVADFNSDGRPDVVIVSQHSPSTFIWYEGPVDPKTAASGTFAQHIINNSTGSHKVNVADFNNDGLIDIQTSLELSDMKIFYNEGGNTPVFTQQNLPFSAHNARIGDIGNDGDIDIFGADWTGHPPTRVWINNLDPVLTLPLDRWTYKQVTNSLNQTFGLTWVDVDADGDLDIASGNFLFRNPGGNMTGTWTTVNLPRGHAVLATNIDDDANADIITMEESSGALRLFWVEATDTIGSAFTVIKELGTVPSASHSLGTQGHRTAQIVAGGKEEIILSTGQGNSTSPDGIYYFTIPANPQTTAFPRVYISNYPNDEGFGVGDVDNDGDIDIASATGNSRQVRWYENPGNGAGNWASYVVGSTSEWGDRVEIADLDGDGKKDIVVTEENGQASGANTYWYKQPTAGPKTLNWTRTTIVTQGTTNSMDAEDFDRDGDIDILTGEHRGNLEVSIFENSGTGTFTKRLISQGRESHDGTKAVDLDFDSDLDIISIAYDASNFLHLYRNDARSGGGSVPTATPIPLPTSTPTPSGPTPTLDPSSLVAAYPFSENMGSSTNSVTGQHHGTLSGTTWTSTGKYGSALSFNGSSSVNTGNWDIAGSALTLMAWINPTATTDDYRIISKATGPQEQDHYWMLSLVNGTQLRFRLKTNGTTTTMFGGSIPVNTWSHVAAIYDGSTMQVLINGSPVASINKTGTLSTSSTTPVLIGSNPNAYAGFIGDIDEVRVYSRALSLTEIQSSMNTPIGFATSTPTPLPGDANGDRAVNILDYAVLSNTFGSTIDLRADFNGSGNINILDYQILANNFGRSG